MAPAASPALEPLFHEATNGEEIQPKIHAGQGCEPRSRVRYHAAPAQGSQNQMTYSAIVCIITWLISVISWLLVSSVDTSAAAESFEIAFWLTAYFSLNAWADLIAYRLISLQRLRWTTRPLQVVLLCSIILHVAGGLGYALDYDYSGPYIVGMWVVAIAQALSFMGPWAHRRYCSHQRKRRAAGRSIGAFCVDDDWVPRGKGA